MLFRLTNTLAMFQATINHTLQEYLDIFILIYLNNILVYIKGTLEDYIGYIKKVLTKLLEYKLLLKPEKCKFYKKEVKFLGFIILREGIRPNPKKIRVI